MCGITGFIDERAKLERRHWLDVGTQMATTLRHRGPDDAGIWIAPEAPVLLAHRRLSIQDLSQAGHQPMHSPCDRYVVVYNGEIYNFPELQETLRQKGSQFRGHSDTEVLLHAISHWGIENAVKKLNGMFAIALWDKHTETLTLIRDRVGEKPLYWSHQNGMFFFGSELKALCRHPLFQRRIDRQALASYFRHNYVPAPHTIYEYVHKLQPGCMLQYRLQGTPEVKSYWSMTQVSRSPELSFSSDSEAKQALKDRVIESVRSRLVSDVPVGAFLSGGIDSSLITAVMQSLHTQPIKTFSIGFDDANYNEAEHAKKIAAHLGTDHTEVYLQASQALALIPRLPDMYDEPFADSSQIPTFLVSKLARKDVTVALSGDGGDELFAGYTRYLWGEKIWRQTAYLPSALRSYAAQFLWSLSPKQWDKLACLIPARFKPSHVGDKCHKLASVLSMKSPMQLYQRLISMCADPSALVIGVQEYQTPMLDEQHGAYLKDFCRRMQLVDTQYYLPDDILVKVDRASMAVSLESRIPLLDHRLVEFAWQLPMQYKKRDGVSKWLLRQLLYDYVPASLIDRPKQGFAIPVDAWLRGPLREWAEDLISPTRLQQEGYLDSALISDIWQRHLSGHVNFAPNLWGILMFQAWLAEQSAPDDMTQRSEVHATAAWGP